MRIPHIKWTGFLLAAIVALPLLPGTGIAAESALPDGPAASGDVWTVTPENAQETLDGAYGSIDGKTIHFSAGTYTDALVLARPTKYSGSNTLYYSMYWDNAKGTWIRDEQPTPYEEFVANHSGVVTYVREVSGVTFTAEDGVVLPGFTSSSGHVYGTAGSPAYDYVLDRPIESTNGSYHGVSSLREVAFDGLVIQNGVFIKDYSQNAENIGLTFTNCVFLGDLTKMSTAGYTGISLMADSKSFDDIEVSGCTYTNYFQGIYTQGANGLQLRNNQFDNTTHNAIAVQGSSKNSVRGKIVIAENIIKNAADRAIRFGPADTAEAITISNNVMIDSGDADGQLLKAESLPVGDDAVTLEYNYWDGRDAQTAVANEAVRPEHIGIVGGTFTEDVAAYRAPGYVVKENDDGTFTVETAKDTVTLISASGEPQTLEVEAGQTAALPIPTWSGHTFDGWYDSAGNKAEAYTASADGTAEATFTAKWTHSYGTGWVSDEANHWHACACGDKTDVAAHNFQWVEDKAATATEKGSKHEECTICGYKKAAVDIPAIGVEPVPTTTTATTQPPATTKPGTGSTDIPETGDRGGWTFAVAMLLLAGSGMIGLALCGRKRKYSK